MNDYNSTVYDALDPVTMSGTSSMYWSSIELFTKKNNFLTTCGNGPFVSDPVTSSDISTNSIIMFCLIFLIISLKNAGKLRDRFFFTINYLYM